jgi:hypothetical protein
MLEVSTDAVAEESVVSREEIKVRLIYLLRLKTAPPAHRGTCYAQRERAPGLDHAGIEDIGLNASANV